MSSTGFRRGSARRTVGFRVSFRGGSAGVPRGFRGGSAGVPCEFSGGSAGVPWGSGGFRTQVGKNCSMVLNLGPLGALSEKYGFSQLEWASGHDQKHGFLAHCAVERPLEIWYCSLFLKLKKGKRRQRGIAGVCVVQTVLEFYRPQRFPAVGLPELAVGHQRHVLAPALPASEQGWRRLESRQAESLKKAASGTCRRWPCSPADRTGASWSPGKQKPT